MKEIQEAIEKFKGKWWKYSLSPTSQLTEYESDLLHLLSLVAEKQRGREPKLNNGTYYLVLTIFDKWAILLWKDKWWSDECQDEKLMFGIKDEFVKTYYSMPTPLITDTLNNKQP